MNSKIIGILPMAGKGTRLQPLGFSKELYPVVYKEKHFAISEFSVKAMLRANVDEIRLVVHPDKVDIAKYYSSLSYPIALYFYASTSLPESCLYPIWSLRDEDICLFGLPDTIFSPNDGYIKMLSRIKKGADITLGVFKVSDASKYDSVAFDLKGKVSGVLVKSTPPLSDWVWGIWAAKVKVLKKLKMLIENQKFNQERLLGVGFNNLSKIKGVKMEAVKIGENYFDVGTMDAVIKANQVVEKFQL